MNLTAAKTKTLPVHCRWMIRRDMEAVMAIEASCFEFPWRDEDFMSGNRSSGK